MDELVKLLREVQPASLLAIAVVGLALERKIARLREEVVELRSGLALLLGSHRVVNCASDPKTDVGSNPGPPGA